MNWNYVIVYDGMFYTKGGWGVTFTPNINDAMIFDTMQKAYERKKEFLKDFPSAKIMKTRDFLA